MRIEDRYDVIVVGGGPAGCYAAKVIAEQGLRVLVIEKDSEIGMQEGAIDYLAKPIKFERLLAKIRNAAES